MPRNKKRNRRRIHRNLFGSSDVAAVVDNVRKSAKNIAIKVERGTQVEQLSQDYIDEATGRTGLFFPSVPSGMTASAFVCLLHKAMFEYNVVHEDYSSQSLFTSLQPFKCPILRCRFKLPKNNNRSTNAIVLVRSKEIADSLVRLSPLLVSGHRIVVKYSDREELPLGMSVKSIHRDGVDCPTFDIGRIQLGHMVSPTVFGSLWNSHHNYYRPGGANLNGVDPLDAKLQIDPAIRHISITTKQAYSVLSSDTRQSCERNFTRIRLEIPFSSVSTLPFVQNVPSDPTHRAICILFVHNPFIFREKTYSDGKKTDPCYWDIACLNEKPSQWVRTVDPTPTKAISASSSVRFIIEQETVSQLLQHFRYLGESKRTRSPIPNVAESKGYLVLSIHNVIQQSAYVRQVPFGVRYMAASVLSFKQIDVSKVTERAFWDKLYLDRKSESEALQVLDLMYTYVSGSIATCDIDVELYETLQRNSSEQTNSALINPLQLLLKCQRIYGMNADTSQGYDNYHLGNTRNGNFDNSMIEDDDSDSSSSDIEDFVLDQTFRALQLDGASSSSNQQPDPMSGITRASSPSMDTSSHYGPRAQFEGVAYPRLKKSKQEAWIRRVSVTPTCVIPHPPELELLNRVLRQFSEHRERFIRVSFCDEDGCRIAHKSSPDLLYWVRMQLAQGIVVAGEKFVFLAFSNSQLREGSLWMYNETYSPQTDTSYPPTADQIRMWMGDFSHIRSPGKFASRQGQTFSSTVSTVSLDPSYWKVVPDIKDITDTYMFSDGIGLMKYELAMEMARKLKIGNGNFVPSAFQIRFGGAKGMLTVWDEAFPPDTEENVRVHIRDSMNKFNTDHCDMEVVGYSKRIPLYLNRQIIAVLSGHGVPDRSFEKLQRNALQQLDVAMTANGRGDALRLLLDNSNNDFSHRLASSGTGTSMTAFFDAGMSTPSSEHLYNMMLAYRRRLTRDMISKSRIPIDHDKGFCAIGVLDELGVLGSREIFCQYTDPRSGEIVTVTGPVTVGRSPCLHPGDIQPVECVERVELMHLVDVIVFPRNGYRPIPSMLSGGDLDGDIFFVIFDPCIELPTRWEITPMDYSAPKPVTLDHNVTWEDVADFFVEFIDNDCVGLVANAHVVQADKDEFGVSSQSCLKLATMHSGAVDFPKTGVSVAKQVRDSNLLPRHLPEAYPDFMGKHPKMSYQSKKVLGKLHRACNAHFSGGRGNANNRNTQDIKVSGKFEENEHSWRVHDIFYGIHTPASVMEDAVYLCNLYNSELQMLMIRFGVISEGELISGNVLGFDHGVINIRDAERQPTAQIRVNREVRRLRNKYREEFFSDIFEGEKERAIIKASAWYKACRQVADSCDNNSKTRLVSFPWVVSDVLLSVIKSQLLP